ncbi:premnaspirodiene oxygenase-like [Ananas comosus]|uniref:Premnaspirodiene oxygenase n=1 Tax=Ananas comosus TaxID=4615 RepID=A0A199W8R1_ANACO|nr:premnaspirodiene oxygenase-like [Ananas comosus]OAY85280.1 Premnaspirodiene oxygenase [Ananas comosus]
MEIIPLLSRDHPLLIIPSLLFLSLCILLMAKSLIAARSSSGERISKLLPGPRALPLIGSMHHVSRAHRGPAHWALRELARAHGPLMLLRMGHVRLAVASSPETAEAILRTQDLNFAFRPQLLVGQIVGYGCSDMVFSPYGLYYKQLRRICLTELLGPKRVRAFASIRKHEVAKLIEDITAAAAAGPKGSVVNLTRRLTTMTNAMISRAAFGGQNAQHHRFLEVAQSAVEAAAGFSVADAFPSLRFLDVLSGLRPRLQKVRRELDEVFDEIIEQHQQKKKNTADECEEEDLIDLLLRLKDHGDLEAPLSIDNIKAVILDLFLAGTDTSSALLQWVMSELIRNPKVMAKAQTEVREALKGDDGIVIEEAQVNELHYLKLVVKETLRLHPPVPLLLPRVCQSTCHVAGYEIPAGTRIMVNAWAIARDPEHWSEPERFVPERFAAPGAADYKGSSFEYLPFGSGRRMCPGMVFGLASVNVALAELLRRFDWRAPDGTTPEELSMEEVHGITAARKVDLVLVATPVDPQ